MTTVSEDVKCIEKERQALLNFKQSLFDDYGMLSTWRDDHDSRDCCKWRGVVCGNETGHVLKLRLRGSRSYQSIQYLSGNNLLGSIPVCLKNFTAMVDKSIDLSGIVRTRLLSTKDRYEDMYESNVLLTWKGQDYLIKNPELLLKSIDLSSNHISGAIPTELAQLLGLVSLNLSRNNLSGEIPSDIGNLNLLEFLDLSNNRLSGKIPSTLSLIDRLGVLDLSNNSLYGKIPSGAQLQTFEPSSFEGNLGLCGKPLERSCPEDEIPIKPQGPAADDKDDNSVFYEALYMSLGIGFFTGFWGLIGSILLWKPWRNAYLKFLNKLSVNLAKWCR